MSPRRACLSALMVLALAGCLRAQIRRVVVVKVDGLGNSVLERWLNEHDPKTGKSTLPWIEHVFVQGGARLANFYVRGVSLSVPSWSLLDTGRPLVIRGNAEFDRATGRVYDYLNFFPFYFYNARSARADMPAVEVLDQAGIPLLADSFPPSERLQGLQLFQRGVRWQTLKNTLPKRFRTRSIRQLFNEWQTGFELIEAVNEQVERELVAALPDRNVLYLDYFFGDYDHVIHLANDEASQKQVMEKLDRLVGRLWTAIEQSPLAKETAFVLLSDHGINSDPAIYSQGYNLIELFNSAAGGGHHVLTNRYPLTEYRLKGLDPFVSQVVTPSSKSLYLAGEAEAYPTALLDLDGNERAAIYLRNSAVNEMHLWLKRAVDGSLPRESRFAAAKEFAAIVARQRERWSAEASRLEEELPALDRAIGRRRNRVPDRAPRWTPAQRKEGLASAWRRQKSELGLWERQFRDYSQYAAWLRRVLAVTPEQIVSGKMGIQSLIPRRLALDCNNIHELQNYAVNLREGSIARVNYFPMLTGIRVRNNVQSGVGPKPVDFVAATIPREAIRGALPESDWPDRDAVFLYSGEDRQVLLLERGGLIRYLPVRGLTQDAAGRVTFEKQDWVADLPLRYYEDPSFVPDPAGFLGSPHTEQEWFEATHRTRYSNAIAGLISHFAPIEIGPAGDLWEDAGTDTALLRRFAERLRAKVASDLLVLANDHWNFNVRGFNPGGNHGSFFRVSTHSVLMVAGGGVPRGTTVERPYDSLSFVPTILKLTGRGDVGQYPGPVIQEILPSAAR